MDKMTVVLWLVAALCVVAALHAARKVPPYPNRLSLAVINSAAAATIIAYIFLQDYVPHGAFWAIMLLLFGFSLIESPLWRQLRRR